jgi:hypothetical protein
MTKKILATLATLALLTAAPVHAQDINAEDDAIIGASGTAHADTDVQASFRGLAKDTGVSFSQAYSCGTAVGAFIAGNAVAVAKLRKAGGIIKVAKKVLTAEGRLGKMEAVAAVFAEMAGMKTVVDGCS